MHISTSQESTADLRIALLTKIVWVGRKRWPGKCQDDIWRAAFANVQTFDWPVYAGGLSC